MKKLLLAMVCLASSTFAFADAASVKITSFTYVTQERKIAELCGVVSNAQTSPTFVQVTVDERSKRPATYNTIAGENGKFCLVVTTYYGTAVAKAL